MSLDYQRCGSKPSGNSMLGFFIFIIYNSWKRCVRNTLEILQQYEVQVIKLYDASGYKLAMSNASNVIIDSWPKV